MLFRKGSGGLDDIVRPTVLVFQLINEFAKR